MARHLTQKPFIPQDVNISNKLKASKPEIKKGGGGLGSRKALGDITNKASIHRESLSKKKDAPKGEFNIAEEKFLHDHRKCIEALQAAAKMPHFMDIVLPGYDPKSTAEIPNVKPVKVQGDQEDFFSKHSYLEPMEIELPELSDSPRTSSLDELLLPPVSLDSPPAFSFEMKFDPVEFSLKEEDATWKEECLE